MIIGITRNTQAGKEKIKDFLTSKYGFKYIDVDQILEEKILSLREGNEFPENWRTNRNLLFQIRNSVDLEIQRIVESSKDETIVLDYSLLENSYYFDNCDLVIKSNFNINKKASTSVDLYKKHQANSVSGDYSNSKYQLEVNFDENWEEQIQQYLDFNVFGEDKVTVVVPIYNTADYISRCVKSITSQTYRNLEILLIVDGATDESLEICTILANQDPRIKVIYQSNKGLAETRNEGMKHATGEYICFIDSDDYIENPMIETLLKTIKETNTDVCECSFFIHLKDGGVKDVTCEQKGVKTVTEHLDLINAYSDATILIPAWDKLYRLDSIRDIPFDKTCFKEDSDYIYKLCMADKTFSLVPQPFYHYIKRKNTSLTGHKISKRLFDFQDWGKKAYNDVLSQGEEYRDAAEKILYNTLVHILRNYMRDYKNKTLEPGEYQAEIQDIANQIFALLLHANNVKKFRKLDEVLDIINELVDHQVLDREQMPSMELPCIGIIWNSLDDEMKKQAIEFIKERATITDSVEVDLADEYKAFIRDIYLYNLEFEGIPVLKAGTLIDRYDSNKILILNLLIKVSNITYFSKQKGFMFEEVAELKTFIRKYFKTRIKDYAYDNVFHMTVDDDEYGYTDGVCKKYVKEYRGSQDETKQ